MNSFDFFAPANFGVALDLLAQHGDAAKVIAGGTGLVNLMKQRLVNPEVLVSLGRLSHLREMAFASDGVHFGALCTHESLINAPDVRQRLPLLWETYSHVATPRIRNVATVGGGLAHGDPNQDPPVSFLALDATVSLKAKSGERTLPIHEFLVDYYETAIRPDEILVDVLVPLLPENAGYAYLKFLPRTADDYATVSAAAIVVMNGEMVGDVRLAIGSAAPTARRCSEAEQMLAGQKPTPELIRAAAETARAIADPVSDGRGSADYKKEMVPVFVRRALEKALQRAEGKS